MTLLEVLMALQLAATLGIGIGIDRWGRQIRLRLDRIEGSVDTIESSVYAIERER